MHNVYWDTLYIFIDIHIGLTWSVSMWCHMQKSRLFLDNILRYEVCLERCLFAKCIDHFVVHIEYMTAHNVDEENIEVIRQVGKQSFFFFFIRRLGKHLCVGCVGGGGGWVCVCVCVCCLWNEHEYFWQIVSICLNRVSWLDHSVLLLFLYYLRDSIEQLSFLCLLF